jgi:pimeloyl-[acyl-carrier protein] synthase
MNHRSLPHPDNTAWNQPPQKLGPGQYLISNYRDVTRALQDPRFASRVIFAPAEAQPETSCPWLKLQQFFKMAPPSPRSPHQVRAMLRKSFSFIDGDDHDRLLRPIKKIFSSRLQSVQASLEQTVGRHLERAAAPKPLEWMDHIIKPFIGDTIETLCEFPDGLKPDLCAWFDPLEELFSSNPAPSRERYEAFLNAVEFVEKCLAFPALEKNGGLVAQMARLSEKPTGFSRDEICAGLLIMLMAANHSARQAIAESVRTLIERPDLLHQLQTNPDLLPLAIQEFLRVHVPLKMLQRQLTEDFAVNGAELKAGDYVLLDLATANMDPEVFVSPEKILLTRTPNPHLTFGLGTHFCLGAPMARLQMESFLAAFIRRSRTTRFTLATPETAAESSPYPAIKLWVHSSPA